MKKKEGVKDELISFEKEPFVITEKNACCTNNTVIEH
jgi:hypothetical protein